MIKNPHLCSEHILPVTNVTAINDRMLWKYVKALLESYEQRAQVYLSSCSLVQPSHDVITFELVTKVLNAIKLINTRLSHILATFSVKNDKWSNDSWFYIRIYIYITKGGCLSIMATCQTLTI